MYKKIATIAVLILALVSVNVLADGYNDKMGKAEKMADKMTQKSAEHVTLEGKIVCMSCDLKKTEGASAACSVYGHQHALKTTDGKYVNFLENKHSEDLFKGEKYQNKNMKIHGIHYANANMLEVETFQVGDKTMSWCGHCSKMDACMASK